MKYKLFIISLLILPIVLVGCGKKDLVVADVPTEVADSGTTIDVTTLNGQNAEVETGDIIYLKLTGEAGSGRQWTVVAPTSTSAVRLVDHKVVGINDANILGGEFTDEWWIKILESEDFMLKFDYGILGQEVEDSYSVNIVHKQ